MAEFHDANGPARPVDLGDRRVPRWPGRLSRQRRELVRGRRLRGVRAQALPTVYHWYGASGAFSVFSDVLSVSNFSGQGTARVGQHGGVGPFGTYDMAGNVKEWCWNSTNAGRRFVLGGAFADADYQFRDEDAQLPFERRAGFGLRLIEQAAPLEAKLHASDRDRRARPGVAQSPYPTPSIRCTFGNSTTTHEAPRDDGRGHATDAGWRREKVSVAAAYGSERLPLYVFVPSSSTPRHSRRSCSSRDPTP